jgi:glycosyltransferase involved in cell wall biosynthesis
MFFSWRRMAGLAFLALPLGLRSERSYRAMPRLTQTRIDESLPMLSIIVPARNEAANLPYLLSSLQRLSYPGACEVIVVDDHSTDTTAKIAATYGARVIRLDCLPAGWRGKPHASHQGALVARGAWLLFTDADTLHRPTGPARAVACAVHNGLDGLSLFLRQDCRSQIERLPLMAAFAGLFAGLGPASNLLNGQFILLRRDVYRDSGGFAAVRLETQDDLALGKRLSQLGYHVPMMRGEEAGSVRMYAGAAQVWHGMSRLGSNTLRWSGFGAVLTGLFISALMSPLIVAIGVLSGRLDRKWLLATYLSAAISMVTWGRRFGSASSALLAPMGALWVQAAATWGLISRSLGRNLHWKGRPVN